MKKRIFSGAQPTGQLHIGNYLGALKNWVALQDEYESFYCIVNLHAITLPQDPGILRQKTLDLARIYLAAGIDPEKSTVFIQSDVPAHAELTWILSCVSRMGELERMTQFKDKSQKRLLRNRWVGSRVESERDEKESNVTGKPALQNYRPSEESKKWKAKTQAVVEDFRSKSGDHNTPVMPALIEKLAGVDSERAWVGLFIYPVLMAADILLYQTDLVPIGKDQKQHLELTRDLAERFNRDFGETFKIPEPYIPPVGANILSLQDPTKKMSKSDENANGSIFLLDDADTITKKIKRAVTDSGTEISFDATRPAITNLLTIFQLLTGRSQEECVAHFEGKGYGHFKGELAGTIVEFLRPFQEKVSEYDDASLDAILKTGAEKAREIAAVTLRSAYDKIGIVGSSVGRY